MTSSSIDIRRQVETIPDRLKELKGERSTAGFARFLNVGVSTLHNYENGRTPPIEFLLNVAARTGVSIEWLLTGTGAKYRRESTQEPDHRIRRVLVVDDKQYQRDSICNVLEAEGYQVVPAGSVEESMQKLEGDSFDVVVTDLRMPEENDGLVLLRHIREQYPRIKTIIITVHAATAPVAVEAIRSGAYDYLVMSRTFPEDLRSAVSRAMREIQQEEASLENQPERLLGEIVGLSPAIRSAVETLKKAAASPRTPVLIQGEAGTGKELFAKTLHANDPRRSSYAFVPVKCGSMPEETLALELFGVAPGTSDRPECPGVFSVADGGTVFLDEIDKVSLAVQVSLLRILDEGTFTSVGGVQPRKTDVRLVCATSADLTALAVEGRFRRDLLTRLEVLTVYLPPLIERGDDLDLLAKYFLRLYAEQAGKECRSVSPGAVQALREYPWPDNVRGLQAVIERAVLFSDRVCLDREDIIRAAQALGRPTGNHALTSEPSS